MTKRLVKLAILFALIAANMVLYTPAPTNVPFDIKPYVDIVYEVSNGNLDGRKLNYKFSPRNSGVLATCYVVSKKIRIDRDHWEYLSERSKVVLIAHEIAHCMKFINHIKGTTTDGCTYHFMNDYLPPNFCIYQRYEEYINQMRNL